MTEPTNGRRKRWPLHYQILLAMVIGTVAGIALNPGEHPIDGDLSLELQSLDGHVTLTEWTTEGDGPRTEIYREEFPDRDSFVRSYPRLADRLSDTGPATIPITNGRVRLQYTFRDVTVVWRREHDSVPAVSEIRAARVTELPTFWKTVAPKFPANAASDLVSWIRFVGDLFLRLLKMITVPLILTSLVTGVTGLGQHGRFGRMFSTTMVYYVVTSMLAITTGIILVNIIGPGVNAVLPGGGRALKAPGGSLADVLMEQIMRLIPENPIQAIAGGEFLSIISFAILLGTFINLVGGESGRRLAALFEAAFQVMMRMTSAIISLAPIGVAAFMVHATATQGIAIFGTLAKYMITVFIALSIHAIVTLPLLVWLLGRRNPWEFAKAMSPSLLTAFSTASSNAALPLTITCVEERAGVSNRVSSFVLPLGATINMDGTALYEAVAVLFIAQATPGIDLTLVQQITVAFTALLASVGAAGIPHAGLVMMAIVLQAVGLPLEAQGVIIAVDRILDMCRTTVNVWSDACGCAVVDRMTNASPAADAPGSVAGESPPSDA